MEARFPLLCPRITPWSCTCCSRPTSKGRRTLPSKLTHDQADMIRVFKEAGYTTGQLAKEYGVHADTIRNVVKGASFTAEPKDPKLDGHRRLRKLTDDQVRVIRKMAGEGFGEHAISRQLGKGVHRATIPQ